jgi:small nuclear ribonucleoprotein (snRNP)-like protein
LSIKNHGGTYRHHRVRMVMRDGEVISGRFDSCNDRFINVRLTDGTLRKIMRRKLRTFAVANKGMEGK